MRLAPVFESVIETFLRNHVIFWILRMPKRKAVALVVAKTPAKKRKTSSTPLILKKRSQNKRLNQFKTRAANKPEVKRVDFNDILVRPTSSGVINLLSGFSQGVDDINRIGKRLSYKGIQIALDWMYKPQIAHLGLDIDSDIVDNWLIFDKQCNGSFPTVSQIIQSVDNAGSTTTDAQSYPNWHYKDRFLVLRTWRKIFPRVTVGGTTIQPPTALGPMDQTLTFIDEDYIKLRSMIQEFIGTGTTIGSIGGGAIYLVTISNIVGGNSVWECGVSGRITFIDM